MSPARHPLLRKLLTGLLALGLGACSAWGTQGRETVASSLVSFLYPDGSLPVEAADAAIPRLRLPVRVGLAFVPSHATHGEPLSEALKNAALERVRTAFDGRPYIRDIQIIPDAYLRTGSKGFQTLDPLARLYGIDVIALVSYDQVAHIDDRKSALLYWTIAGAYAVKGTRNEAVTFVDTAVLDIASRRLLFRAPGADRMSTHSTLVEADRSMRALREQSFLRAMDGMSASLDVELARFRERIQTDGSVEVTRRDGRPVGAGSFGAAALLLMLAGWRWRALQASAPRSSRTCASSTAAPACAAGTGGAAPRSICDQKRRGRRARLR
jgi:rhombotail lipoprotein